MDTQATTTHAERPRRADAQRNHDALVTAARAALATDGGGLVLESIARDAGVGIGTLYRNFPTREALVEAVYAVELQELMTSAPALLDELPPDQALREWLARYAHFAATKRGMRDALRSGVSDARVPATTKRARLAGAVGLLLDAGARDGSLRGDVDPQDVTALLVGVFLSADTSPAAGQTERLLDLVLDALRPPRR